MIERKTVRKSWNFSMIQSETLHTILEEVLSSLECGALVLPDGRTLHVKPACPSDLVTLPQAASLCHQYLRLKDGEVAILNDPYSGGTTLSHLTFVTGVRFDPETATDESDLLLVSRVSLGERIPEGSRLDDEGVRIPPTPIVANGQLNTDLLAAIASHPLAPHGLAMKVSHNTARLAQIADTIRGLGQDPWSEFKKLAFKRYLSDSSLAFETLMARLPLGTTIVTKSLQPGDETLKLKLEIGENRLHFDFAGTDLSPSIALTELATFGACVSAVIGVLNQPLMLNSGVFEHFQVSTPAKTMLSSRYPLGLFRGVNTGTAAVCDLVQTALGHLNSTFRKAASYGAHSHFQIEFAGGKLASWHLPSGTSASKDRTGLSAHATWGSYTEPSLSLESLEAQGPLQILSAGLRPSSGGKGQSSGGDGVSMAFIAKEPGKFRWSLGSSMVRQEGAESGRAGAAAELEVTRAVSGKKEEIAAPEGSLQLEAGDQVHIATSGGGSWGAPE